MKTNIEKTQILARIKRAMSLTTDTELAAFLGINKSTLSNWSKRGSLDFELVFSKCEQISADWLLTGTGNMVKGEAIACNEVQEKKEAYRPTVSQLGKIPLVSISAVGGFGNVDFAIGDRDVKDYYVIPKFKDRKIDFMIEVSGSSMYPKYNSGDVVACRVIKERNFIQWNKVHVVATKEQGILIKRLKKSLMDDCMLAVSDNKDYDPFDLPMKEISGLALVVGVVRLE